MKESGREVLKEMEREKGEECEGNEDRYARKSLRGMAGARQWVMGGEERVKEARGNDG